MSLLPAVVPPIPEVRAEIVPARLARKVAPLFGIPWPEGPFGARTWVSDYSRITLSEIGRGAPLPTRSQSVALGELPAQGWRFVDRMAVAAKGVVLPNEIANATLNRFGPDTKAAVILTAANRLLEPVRAAVVEALGVLADDAGCPLAPAARLTGWAAMVTEVFRSQPALVAAAIRARTIQRQLCVTWELPTGPSAAAAPRTRCEIGAPVAPHAPSRPTTLDVVDDTVRLLGVFDGAAPVLAVERLHEETADRLLANLLAAGTLHDASHLWLAERAPGTVVVEALVPPTGMIDRFVGQALRSAGGESGNGTQLPGIPEPDAFAGLSLLARRAAGIGLLAVLRRAQFSATDRERTRAAVLDRLDRLAVAVDAGLAADDPAGAVARCRIALMRVQIRRLDAAAQLAGDVAELRRATRHCVAAWQAGTLDRGAAAEIVAAANIELNAVRRTNATLPGSDLPSAGELDEELRACWAAQLEMLEVPAAVLDGEQAEPPGLLGYHLHNYAAYLAGHIGDDTDLLTAVRLYRDVVIPARTLFAERTGSTEPLRHSLQTAARAAAVLAERARSRGELEQAGEWATTGLRWINRALADPETGRLLAEPTESACRFALQAAPVLLGAAELDVADVAAVDRAAQLVELATRWERAALEDRPPRYARHGEITTLAGRIDALRARPVIAATSPAIPPASPSGSRNR